MSTRAKEAKPDHPVQELVARRWSPYAFADRDVSDADLRSLFEAARWAPSSYNEQPWRYVVATRRDPAAFADVLSCLIDGNQVWARAAPVLGLGIASLTLARSGKPNAAAIHDLGLAAGNLTFEATARGLSVHQMIGILPERAHALFALPDGYRAVTGLAIGYGGEAASLPDELRARDSAPRQRRPLREFVFRGRFGVPASFTAG